MRRPTKLANQCPSGPNGPPGDQLRPMSRARRGQLPPVGVQEETQMPHHHEPVPPVTHGLNRQKMDKPRVRPSHSGNSIVSVTDVQHSKDTAPKCNGRPSNLTQYQTHGDAALHFPHIKDTTNGINGQRLSKRHLPKIDATETSDTPDYKLPSLTGKVPAPPETAKQGIQRVKAFTHNNEGTATSHPARRLKPVMYPTQVVLTGLQPAPPPRTTDYGPAPSMAAHTGSHKLPSPNAPEAKLSDHILSKAQEHIVLSPSELKAISPKSTKDAWDSISNHKVNHEIIKSPSSLMEIRNTDAGHVIHEKRKTPPSHIDVNIQPAMHISKTGHGASDKHKKRCGRESISNHAINHEIIRSPSSLMDVTNTNTGYIVHEKRKSPPSLIDVNIQPAMHGSNTGHGASDKRNKRRGSRF